MYVLVANKKPAKFPYSIAELRTDNPHTSFPEQPIDKDLGAWDVFPVVQQDPPAYDAATQNLKQVDPVLSKGRWLQTWSVSEASAEEIQQRLEERSAEVRHERNQRLAASDWTQLNDAPVEAAVWAAYRQELRDVTAQAEFPWAAQWPAEPEA